MADPSTTADPSIIADPSIMALPPPTIQMSIRQYLNHPNPVLTLHPRNQQQSERSSRAQVERPQISDNILPWDSLSLTYINNRFGHILDHTVPLPPFPVLPAAQLHLDAESSFESVLLAYNAMLVNNALKAAADLLKTKELVCLRGSYYYLKEQKPDWGGGLAEPQTGSAKFTNWLPGDTKYATETLEILFNSPSEGSDDLRELPSSPPPLPSPAGDHAGNSLLPSDDSNEELELEPDLPPQTPPNRQLPHKHMLSSGPDLGSKRTKNFLQLNPDYSEQPDTKHERPDQTSERAILEQGNGYAAALNTPYFYIITPVELLAVRCYVDPNRTTTPMKTRSKMKHNQHPFPNKSPDQSQSDRYRASSSQYAGPSSDAQIHSDYSEHEPHVHAGIQVKSIPWDHGSADLEKDMEAGDKGKQLGDEGVISYNLGVWVLQMLAAEDRSARTLEAWGEDDAKFLT